MDYPVPNEIQSLLEDLAGKDVVVGLNSEFDADTIDGNVYEFIDDDDVVQCVVATERPLANALGASLAMLPASRCSADEDDPELREFYREVVNVVSGLINNINPVHIRLVPGSDGNAEWPGYESAIYSCKVGDYGEGNMAFATV